MSAPKPRRAALAPDYDPAPSIRLILADHEDFLQRSLGEQPGDPKAFNTRHAAGRAALTHALLVFKLGALVGAGPAEPDLAGLLAAARTQLHDEEGESDDDPADGEG